MIPLATLETVVEMAVAQISFLPRSHSALQRTGQKASLARSGRAHFIVAASRWRR
jgi:hypothetical protein